MNTCSCGRTPPPPRPYSVRPGIAPVSPSSHCTHLCGFWFASSSTPIQFSASHLPLSLPLPLPLSCFIFASVKRQIVACGFWMGRGGSRDWTGEGWRGWAWPRAVFNQLSSVWFAVAAASCSVFIFSFIILNFNEGPFTAPQSNCLNNNSNDDDDDGGPSMVFAALPQWMLMTAVNVRAMMYYYDV